MVIPLIAQAQFLGLATPADGGRVYFTTTLRQKNTTQPLWGKLFQVDSSGLRLLLSRDRQDPATVNDGRQSNPYYILSASTSADGKTLAVAAARACTFGDCTYIRLEPYTTTITTPTGESKDYTGRLQLSASGEWAFGPSAFSYVGREPYLYNLKTGTQVSIAALMPDYDRLASSFSTTGHAVADDGTVAYSTGREIVTIRGDTVRRISVPDNGYAQAPVMDRTGATLVFAVGDTIRQADPTGSGSTVLIQDGYNPFLSDDGRTLLYLANRAKPQIHVYRAGSISRQLGFDPVGIGQAILSGDGSTIYAVTLGGRLLKISATTGLSQELIPRTPYLTANGPFLAPGKLTPLVGVGLTDLSFTADAPLPETINGIRVTIQGKPALLQSVTPDAITVLVPPGVAPSSSGLDTSPIDITLTSPSPFDGPHADVYVAQYAPASLTLPGTLEVAAAHQDWHGIVTANDPAVPGEVIHTYAVGLGDTIPAVAYGQPAPSREPLARLAIPISCADSTDTRGALEIFYQGLAPGFAGVYQIDLRLPSAPVIDPSTGSFGLYCVWGGIGSGGPGFGGRIPFKQASPPTNPSAVPKL